MFNKLESIYDPIFARLPYWLAAGIVRTIKVAIAGVIAFILVALGDGSIAAQINFLPGEYVPFIIMALTTFFTGLDKSLRARGVIDEVTNLPTSGIGTGPDDGQPEDPVMNQPL